MEKTATPVIKTSKGNKHYTSCDTYSVDENVNKKLLSPRENETHQTSQLLCDDCILARVY